MLLISKRLISRWIALFALVIPLVFLGALHFNVGFSYETQFIPEAPATLQEVLKAKLMLPLEDGKFHPEKRVSRAELATILTRTFNLEMRSFHINAMASITDVKPDYWAYKAIEKVVNQGIMSGYRKGLFYPEQKVTRAEGFAIFAQAFGVYSFKETTINEMLNHYTDQNQIPVWARKAIATAASEGFINAKKGQLRPLEPMTRGDMAYALGWWIGRKNRYSPSTGL